MSDATAETIVSVATGTPDGGVAIIRVSGPGAHEVVVALCGSCPPPRRASVRAVGLRGPGDRAVVLWCPGPGSFTGEDVAEFHVHGGERNVRDLVDQVQELGPVPAGPGEFTRRAFLNGSLDLAQAEGIAAVVGARTEAGLEQARRLAGGELGREVEQVRRWVRELRVEVEANLDFPDEVEETDRARWREELARVSGELGDWLARFEAGRAARERPRVVIAGPPNVGKSSLFNRLLEQDRALVDSGAGTTRDYVEALAYFGNREVWLVDTAGQHEGSDGVERAGIARARDQVAEADCVVWVQAPGCESAGAGAPVSGPRVILVGGQCDRGPVRAGSLAVSARTGAGIEALRGAVRQRVEVVEEGWIGLGRHRARVEEAVWALGDAAAGLEGEALELVAFALAVADGRLGEITGRTALGAMGEEVLDAIFNRFCIGK